MPNNIHILAQISVSSQSFSHGDDHIREKFMNFVTITVTE
ncbi:unnamed protein product, partial [Rotaria magnacalcarata]